MFDGKLEVRKASDHSLVMRGIEEERLLKLQGTSAHAQHFSYYSQQRRHIILLFKTSYTRIHSGIKSGKAITGQKFQPSYGCSVIKES